MSPSEFELRTALRHGEGERPDPDALLAAGRARASARRTRILASAGAVVAVLAIGTTGGILLGRGGDHPSPAGQGPAAGSTLPPSNTRNAAREPSHAPGSVADAPGPSSAGAGAGAAATGAASCPTDFGAPALGSGIANPSADQPILPADATSVLVCGYGSSSSGVNVTPGEKTLTGTQASDLVSSINAAPSTKPHTMCSMLRVAEDHRYAFVAVDATGASTPVFTTLGNPTCQVVVSGRSGVRYAWAPAPALAGVLATITSK